MATVAIFSKGMSMRHRKVLADVNCFDNLSAIIDHVDLEGRQRTSLSLAERRYAYVNYMFSNTVMPFCHRQGSAQTP